MKAETGAGTSRYVVGVLLALALAACSRATTNTEVDRGASAAPEAEVVDDVLAGLATADERHQDTYQRDLFPHWATVDGCSVRERVLIDESLSAPQVDPFGCFVVAGDWRSRYDGSEISDPAEMEIDHLVPLAEAWRSGAWAWDEARRRAFANDLDDPASLAAVSSASNQAKGDADPAVWKPSDRTVWCAYATDWIIIKERWGLSVDRNERAALASMRATC